MTVLAVDPGARRAYAQVKEQLLTQLWDKVHWLEMTRDYAIIEGDTISQQRAESKLEAEYRTLYRVEAERDMLLESIGEATR